MKTSIVKSLLTIYDLKNKINLTLGIILKSEFQVNN